MKQHSQLSNLKSSLLIAIGVLALGNPGAYGAAINDAASPAEKVLAIVQEERESHDRILAVIAALLRSPTVPERQAQIPTAAATAETAIKAS